MYLSALSFVPCLPLPLQVRTWMLWVMVVVVTLTTTLLFFEGVRRAIRLSNHQPVSQLPQHL